MATAQTIAAVSTMDSIGDNVSLSAGQTKIRSDYQSVGEQSAIRAGDGGFQVNVAGQSALIGAQITSSEQAVQQGRNRYEAQAGTTTTDLQNTASYSAQSASVGVSAGASKPGASMSAGLSGAGVGSDSGQASSNSTAGISGIAGDSAARTGDAQTGLKPIFDKDEVKAEVQAQVAITAEFGKQASRAVGDYASAKFKEAETNVDQEGIDAWKEGGSSRVALHALVGGLTGGVSGAVGAAAASAAAPAIEALQTGFQSALKDAGVSEDAAQLIASLAGGATAASIGGAVGGTAGAATAFNADMNNRQLHPSERKLAQELAKKSGGKYTAEEIENALRSAGNTQTGESIVAGMVVDPKSRDAIYDKGAVWTVGENGTLVQVLPPAPDAALVAYIQQNTGQTYGWYAPSNTTAASSPSAPRDRLTNQPLDEKGRYTQTVVLDGQMYQPKYLPCATPECLRTASNLDMSDPQTQAYVKALDEQVFKDIGTGATVGTLVTPVGVPGAGLGILGLGATAGQVATSDTPYKTGWEEFLKATSEKGGAVFFEEVLGHTPGVAARASALINLSGGWEAFVERVNIDLLGIKSNDKKD